MKKEDKYFIDILKLFHKVSGINLFLKNKGHTTHYRSNVSHHN